MAKTYKVSTVEVSAQSRKEWLARKRGKGEVAASAAAVVVQSEASSAPSALDALFRQVNIGTDDAPKYVAEALFPLRIGDALLDWHADQKYLGVEHATESEKANFFASGGVSCGGVGSSSGGSGEGGSSTLAGLNDVSLKSAIANDMLVYNGTHWVNTPMSAIKPDLTDYATKSWVEGKGYALNTALLKVDARLANVEAIFEEDQDGAINKWSEVVAFLDGIEGDTLDGILAQFATMRWVEGKKYITADGLAPYALRTDIPTKNSELENDAEYITAAALNGYATQSWVKDQKYLDGIDSTMVIAALGYTPYNADNFTKANIKSTLSISDWALASAKPTYQYSEIQGTPDLSVYFLKTSFTGDNIKTTLGISAWALAASKPSYKWSEINERPAKLSQFTDDVVSGKYLPIGGTAADAAKLGGEAPSYYATVTALTILSDAVTEFRTLFDSLFEKDTANNAIKAKLSLYSVGGITAGGIGSGGSSGGGGGGASYNRLDAWADYSQSKAGYVLSALLGKDLDTRVSALANAGYITASALDPYAKTADVANTYATQTALQGVDIRVQAIEYIFEKDQDGVINKWQEIVDFLAGVEGTTLYSILDQFAKKSNTIAGYGITDAMIKGGIPSSNIDYNTIRTAGTYNIMSGNGSGNSNIPFDITYGNLLVLTGSSSHFTTQIVCGANEKIAVRVDKANAGTNWTDWRLLLHSGNYTDYTVPKTGGTFNGRLYVQTSDSNGFANEMNGKGSYLIHVPNVASTSSWARGLSLYDDATSTTRELIGSFGTSEGHKYDYLGGTYDNYILQLRLSDKFSTFYGDVKTNGKFIGNLQGNADSATSVNWTGVTNKGRVFDYLGVNVDANQYGGGSNVNGIIYINSSANDNPVTSPKPYEYGAIIQFGAGESNSQFFAGSENLLFWRNRWWTSGWSDWKTIAFTDSNVASATKLQTPRTLWGQAFDGTGNVNGDFATSGSVRIGDAILSWDAANKCITIKNVNTGQKASLFVDGGVTATAIN